MIGLDIYKFINGIAVKHRVGSNDNSEMVSQLSLSFPTYNDYILEKSCNI